MAKKTFKRTMMRVAFIAVCALAIRCYVKDSIRVVKKQVGVENLSAVNTTINHHKKHSKSRNLAEIDELDLEDEDFEIEFSNDS